LPIKSFVDQLDSGAMQRTPLLQGNQSIRTIANAVYKVTGGYIELGYLGNGQITRIVGIYVDNTPQFVGHNMLQMGLTQGNQPFNSNFAKVIYKMRTAGQLNLSHSALKNARNGG
jgi:hypothetical protein